MRMDYAVDYQCKGWIEMQFFSFPMRIFLETNLNANVFRMWNLYFDLIRRSWLYNACLYRRVVNGAEVVHTFSESRVVEKCLLVSFYLVNCESQSFFFHISRGWTVSVLGNLLCSSIPLSDIKERKKRKKGKSFFHILIFICFSYTVLLEDMSKDYFIMNLKAIKISTKFIYLFCLSVFLFHSLNVKVNISDILYTFNATFKIFGK